MRVGISDSTHKGRKAEVHCLPHKVIPIQQGLKHVNIACVDLVIAASGGSS